MKLLGQSDGRLTSTLTPRSGQITTGFTKLDQIRVLNPESLGLRRLSAIVSLSAPGLGLNFYPTTVGTR